MSVNSTKLIYSQSPSKVESKYFVNNCVMDESLSDFQEKKSAIKGPKNIKKSAISKPKHKKTKLLKGQKDIRTALKGNQNELINYTREFDVVCKESGLDVDSEQLLLAVALSKSLDKTDDKVDDDLPCLSLNSQGRISKIRTTLQEYGFTVPEIKISKKTRKCKKNYKLLLTTVHEKKQIISDKYAQVLFDACEFRVIDNKQFDYLEHNLYYKATNIPYKDIKNNNAFYVDNLVERSCSSGSLLRNWSDIPGRPSSPTDFDKLNMDFSEIECSQDELDIMLSGSLKSTKNIINDKARFRLVSAPVNNVAEVSNKYNTKIHDLTTKNCSNNFSTEIFEPCELFNMGNKINTSCQNSFLEKGMVTVQGIPRSCSPDIFEDEVGDALNNSVETKNIVYTQIIESIFEDRTKYSQSVDLTQNDEDEITKSSLNTNFTRRTSNDVMEITECVAMGAFTKSDANNKTLICQDSQSSTFSQQSHVSNKTKIISNDFMEITDCVANRSLVSKNIPITSNVDLTNLQDSDDDCRTALKDRISNCSYISNKSCNLSDKPQFSNETSYNDESLDATIILNDDEVASVLKPSPVKTIQLHQNEITCQADSDKVKTNNIADGIKSRESFCNEFAYDHLDDDGEINESSTSLASDGDENKIDSTQSSESVEFFGKEFDCIGSNTNCLGKKAEVSIDYDELYDNVLQTSKDDLSKRSSLSQGSKSIVISDDVEHKNNILSSEISKENSEIFEMCDQELNYSLNKSKCNVPWDNFGGISVVEDFSKLENCNNSVHDTGKMQESNSTLCKSMNDSFLPVINIKKTISKENVPLEAVLNATTVNDFTNVKAATAKTPVSSEYIIKTSQVTPMLDYDSMSTPERNKELDKYGLKRFKRKRAVQLLTHLYNQTHPLVESTSEDILSPSKRLKQNQPSPTKCLILSKEDKSAFNLEDCNIYDITKEVPNICYIECPEEDWVFQKREKAKIYTCRVPLHIAFHNYVSCRRLLREAILRYEPINIDEIHKGLVAIGFRYDPKDLLKFMDKKCITVKTTENNARNNKRY